MSLAELVNWEWSVCEADGGGGCFLVINDEIREDLGLIGRVGAENSFLVRIVCREKDFVCNLRKFVREDTPYSEVDVSSAEAFLAKFALLDKDGYFSEPEEEDPVGDPVESPKRKRKRRRAGQISGRQLALNRIEKEKKKHEGELKDAPHQKTTTRQRPPLPPFVEAVEDMRRTLLEFSAEEEGAHLTFTEDQASAMRVYTSQKYGLTSKDGTNSLLTNMFKVALLPYRLYRKALSIAKNYEEGNLRPPSGCGQRQRLSVTGSTFNFLKSLEPLDVNHQAEIQILLENWEKTGIRPETPRSRSTPKATLDTKTAAKKELEGVKLALKEEKARNTSLKMERDILEKKLCLHEKELESTRKELEISNRNFKAQGDIVKFLKERNEDLEKELRQANDEVARAKELAKADAGKLNTEKSSYSTVAKAHAAHAVELQKLRQTQGVKGPPGQHERSGTIGNVAQKQQQTVNKPKGPCGKQGPAGEAGNAEADSSTTQKSKGPMIKKTKGYKYIPLQQFVETNIFKNSPLVNSRLRTKNK